MNEPRRERGIPSIAASSVAVSLVGVLWVGTGLVLNAVLAGRFGAGAEMDAYLAASTLPTLVAIVLQGGFTLTLVPVVVELEAGRGPVGSRRLLSGLFRWIVVVLGAVSLAGVLAAEPVVGALAPGLERERGALAAALLRTLSPSLLFQGIACYFQGVHYARHRYLLASFAPVAGNATTIAIVVGFSSTLGIASAAWGVVAGALAQCALLLRPPGPGSALKTPGGWRDPAVRRVLALLWPILLGSLFYRGNALIERFIASFGPAKWISFLGYASKVVGLLVFVVTQGLSLALLGRMSTEAARGEVDRLRSTLSRAIRAVLVVATPTVFLLAAAREPVVQILFERRAFLPEDTAGTASALLFYLGAVYGGCLGTAISRVLYALQRTRLAVGIGLAGATLHLLLAFALSGPFGYRGVALAFSISQLATAPALAIAARRLLGRLGGKEIALAAAKAAAASAPAAAAASGLVHLLALESASTAGRIAGLGLAGAAGVLAFVLLGRALRIEEIGAVLAEARRRLWKRAS